jgi:hypothetical protein
VVRRVINFFAIIAGGAVAAGLYVICGGTMKRVVCVVALAAFGAGAHAACEFPYYPEYADVFSQYDEVTQAMAVAAAGVSEEAESDIMAKLEDFFKRRRVVTEEEVFAYVTRNVKEEFPNSEEWDILEPVVVKTPRGEPVYYYAFCQRGGSSLSRYAVEAVISMLKSEDGFDPYKMAENCETLRKNQADFWTLCIEAWTSNGVFICPYLGIPIPLVGDFHVYLSKAETEFGNNGIKKARVFAPNVRSFNPTSLVIAFETGDARTKYFFGPACGIKEITEDDLNKMAEMPGF